MIGRLSCACVVAVVMSGAALLWAEDKPKSQPKVTSVAPLAVSSGSSVTLKIVGLKLDEAASVRVGAAADAPSTQPATQPAATQPAETNGPTASVKSKAKAPVPTGMDAAKVGDDLLEVEL